MATTLETAAATAVKAQTDSSSTNNAAAAVAATMLAVASMVMAAKLRVRLRLLIPAVENSVSGNAFRPMDVVPTRKGITVEIGNTDAEGRLILCDALYEGASEKPAMMIDCATLTGAARVALGTDLPALFCNDDALAGDLLKQGEAVTDPMWRLPLFAGYRRLLDSKVADINNVSAGGFGGAITAALYLKEFVPDDVPWAHFDMMAWNNTSRPGRPEGGEAQAARAIVRRAERAAVLANRTAPLNAAALAYLNRLSDLLFVAARFVNQSRGGDVLWVPGASR